MNKKQISAALLGIFTNFILFAVKLYVGISSNVLCIYCDAINNLGDCLSCTIAVIGFILILKLNETKGKRAEALAGFVIGIIVAVTAVIKLLMGFIYIGINKKSPSPVLKAMIMDSFLDFGITLISLMGFYLIEKINFAADGLFGMIIGIMIFACASKSVFEQAKYLINN